MMPTYGCSVCNKIVEVKLKEYKLLDTSSDLFCSCACLLKTIKKNRHKGSVGFKTEDRQGNIWSKTLRCFFHSRYEESVAKFFIKEGIEYEYENYMFPINGTVYIPDFYLPKYKCFIEVKGFYGIGSKNKLIAFRNEYKSVKLITIPWTMKGFFK